MTVEQSNPARRWPRQPLLSTLMRSPATCRLLALLLTLHFALMQFGFSGWRCPVLMATDYPCPGCGLSRSIMSLGAGDLDQALARHAFGPFAAFALSLLVLSGLLPSRARRMLTGFVAKIEVKTGVSQVLLALCLIYWLVRLLSGRGTIGSLL